MSDQHDDELIERTRAALDDRADQLDYASQLQLQRARAAALAALSPAPAAKPWWQQRVLWLAATPAALAIAVALPLWLNTPAAPDAALADGDNLSNFEDLELLASEADLETLADIEFYQWLADAPAADA